ncbi:hypothetical protein [Mesorhizobium sp.]|uniref:hypothetical protein n=1 Tax=Mesorhizobium sp. TaxID=1871066 RepID=UPI0025CEC866|nr:hypothetical protein [Mesorhizobium sp.]
MKFSAFNQRVTPELNGKVNEIAADLSLDERSGAGFYTVRIGIPRFELTKLKRLTLAPGMPVEVFFSTGSRSIAVLSGETVGRPNRSGVSRGVTVLFETAWVRRRMLQSARFVRLVSIVGETSKYFSRRFSL